MHKNCMRSKNDIALAATSARRYNRHWRAHKLSWTEIGKIAAKDGWGLNVKSEIYAEPQPEKRWSR